MRRLRPDERGVEASAALWSLRDDEGESDGVALERRDCVWFEHCQLHGKQEGWSKLALTSAM